MIGISVLGPVEATSRGRTVSIPGGKTSELLVRLALEAGERVSADRLVEDLWGSAAAHTGRNTLQSKVAKLRRAFEDPGAIVHGGSGYALAADPMSVDALAVLRDVDRAAGLLDSGDDRAAADLSEAALRSFHGELLPSAGDGAWAAPHRARLEDARLRLVEVRLSARMRLGDSSRVIGELEAELARHPYQESLWALLITALYRDGRQADALATYQRVRTLLADELGLVPGPRLRELERQVLAQDLELSGAHGLDSPATSGNLPSLAVELVGRETEVGAVVDLLASARLVEVVGPGGIGKTALAIAVGRRVVGSGLAPGGVWLVRLEAASTADDVLDAVIAALQVTGGEAALLERLRGPGPVIILDNCEQVIDAAAALTARLLDTAAGVRVLCTSQLPLDLDGGAVFELQPLALADAVALFTRRAAARRADDADDLVLELCRSLDGLPLAIELAAARTRTLPIAEISRRLGDRFGVLRDPASRRPERRRALRATIQWSYELLFPDDQRGLWAIAAFSGGAPLAAVESVLEALDVPASAGIDVVGRLAARSLVIVEGDGGRYRLLDSIRAFAIEELADAGLQERAAAAHAAWFADRARSSTEGVRSAEQAEHLAVARIERANIDAALAWSVPNDPLLALDIVNGFGWAWIVLGDSRGARRILAALEAAGDGASARDRAVGLLLAAWIEASTGRLDIAKDHIAAATELAGESGDVDLRARCAYYLAYVVSHEGEWERAMELTDTAHALYQGLDRSWDQAANWLFAARAAISAGDLTRASAARDQVERWLQTVDDPWLEVRREAILGELARLERRFDDAVAHLARAAERSGRLGFAQTEAYQMFSLGRAQCQAGDYPTGAATLEVAIEKAEATGDVRLAALARVHLGRVLRALGRPADARRALEAATAWHSAAAGGEQSALGGCLLAALDAADGIPGAPVRLASILDDARRADDAPVEVFALDALARIAAGNGELAAARELRDVADRRMDAASHLISEFDRADARSVTLVA